MPRGPTPPLFEGPTHPCPRCGAGGGGFAGFRTEHLRHVGWAAYRVATYVNWCWHAQAVIPWPRTDGSVRLIPVLGEAA